MRVWIATALMVMMTSGVAAQEPPKQPVHDEAMMAAYLESAKPTAEHARLAELAGAWRVSAKFWLNPTEAPRTSTGTATARMILGGRFLEMESDAQGAMPMQGLMILGFDRRANDYTLYGIDTLGTYAVTAAGKYDEAQKGVVLDGSYAMPPSGEQQQYRFVWTRPATNEHLLTLWFTIGGQNVRIAETRFTRN